MAKTQMFGKKTSAGSAFTLNPGSGSAFNGCRSETLGFKRFKGREG